MNNLYRFAEFELDPANRVFSGFGKTISLPARAFDLLLYMVRNSGRLLTKEELMKTVWGDAFVEEGNLTQSVFLVRKALASVQPENKIIVTVPGRGYRFESLVTEVLPVEIQPSVPAPAAVSDQVDAAGRSLKPDRRLLWAAVSVVGILTVAGAGWFWYTRAVPGDHHEVVLADFEDTTGEPGFQRAVNIAIGIDLKQSPFLQVTSDAKVSNTLKLMERKPDERLTVNLAREVCQRIDAQAVLSGLIARFGQQYLLTLTASDCANGQELVQTRATAKTGDNILQALDSVAAEMRRRLGEPLRSLRRFSKPLLEKETGSLDALKAYSQAHDIGMQGRFQESIPLFRRALELDPQFAIAWADLGVIYNNLGEPAQSAQTLRRAYELRDVADEPDRLFIIANYHSMVTGDLHEAIRNYETWTEIYARNSTAWASLANMQIQIGRPDLAIDPARRAIAIDVKNSVAYVNLARAQLFAGKVDDAIATCQQAIVQKVDAADVHGILIQAGFADGDASASDAQVVWARGMPSEPYITLQRALLSFAEGKPKMGTELFSKLAEGYTKRGMAERATRMRGGMPRLEAELGMTDTARKALDELPPVEGSTDVPVALAEVGEDARAETILQHDLKEFPQDTLWQNVKGPQIAAAIALARNEPRVAIEALRRGIPYDLRSTELAALRGRAYLAAKQFPQAEAEFRKIIAHPGLEPLSANHALAHLGLARALSLEGNVAGGRAEYESFFTSWKAADADVPVLLAAKSEYAKLALIR